MRLGLDDRSSQIDFEGKLGVVICAWILSPEMSPGKRCQVVFYTIPISDDPGVSNPQFYFN